jgi:hypothetical protein
VPDDPRLPPQWRALDGAHGIARLSKAIGLPGRIPDVLGIALRFGSQDLLLATALAPLPVLHHVLVPATGFDRATFSSLLAHRAGSGIGIIRGRVHGSLARGPGLLDEVSQAQGLELRLEGAGLGPVGPIQRLRAAAYAASRRAVSR